MLLTNESSKGLVGVTLSTVTFAPAIPLATLPAVPVTSSLMFCAAWFGVCDPGLLDT